MKIYFCVFILIIGGCVKTKAPFTTGAKSPGLPTATITTETVTTTFVKTFRPKPVISSDLQTSTNSNFIELKIDFGEAVSGFNESKLKVENATIQNFKGSGSAYTFVLVPLNTGAVRLSIDDEAAADAYGNTTVAAIPFVITYDTTKPTLEIVKGTQNNDGSMLVRLSFSEVIQDLKLESLKLVNATASELVGSGSLFTFTLKPTSDQGCEIILPADQVFDLAGNGNVLTQARVSNTTAISRQIIAESPVKTSVGDNAIWVVTSAGEVWKVKLDPSKGYPSVHWSGVEGGGHRTYVSEIGLLIGQSSGKIFRVDEDVPAESVLSPILNIGPSSQTCVTAFKIGNQAYVGAASGRNFYRVPIDLSKPGKIDVARMETFSNASNSNWGYYCYTDQARNHFWAGWGHQPPEGVDLATGQKLMHVPPNGGKSSPIYFHAVIPNFLPLDRSINLDAPNMQSYGMSGGSDGYLYGVQNGYSSAYDPRSQVVFVSFYGQKYIGVAYNKCFTHDITCSKNQENAWVFDTGDKTCGPMSSLGDGRVACIDRGANKLYTISLVDPSQPKMGIKFELIKHFIGDAYMYSDFTGATAYALKVPKLTLDLSKNTSSFNPSLPLVRPTLKWVADSGLAEAWRGLKLSVRCYKEGVIPMPDFVPIDSSLIPPSNQTFNLNLPQCDGKIYDRVDVSVDPTGSNDFSRTASIVFQAIQYSK